MKLVFSTYYALSAIVMGLTVQIEAADTSVTYFDGKENRTMSINASNFAPSHPDCCVENKSIPTPIPEPVVAKAESDTDGDGVVDSKDECPDTPKGYQVDTKGCPSSVTLHINFDFASNSISSSADKDVTELTQFMKNNPASAISIIGHTDNVGIDARNQPRSEARARALADKLIANGIDANRIKTSGKSSNEPVASNETDEGRAKNRRIEVEIH
jgi:OOP family OmpA-OmpF porin